jgi:hypothetical protein
VFSFLVGNPGDPGQLDILFSDFALIVLGQPASLLSGFVRRFHFDGDLLLQCLLFGLGSREVDVRDGRFSPAAIEE